MDRWPAAVFRADCVLEEALDRFWHLVSILNTVTPSHRREERSYCMLKRCWDGKDEQQSHFDTFRMDEVERKVQLEQEENPSRDFRNTWKFEKKIGNRELYKSSIRPVTITNTLIQSCSVCLCSTFILALPQDTLSAPCPTFISLRVVFS